MKYVAFLRGINVGGKKTVNMAELKASLEKMGYNNVRTLLNSGNVLFETGERSEKKLTKDIEDILEKIFDWRIAVMIRSIDEIKNILAKNPFKKTDGFKCYISFLEKEPDTDLVKTYLALQDEENQFVIKDREIYVKIRNTKDAKVYLALEKKLKLAATSRNVNTVEKLANL
ncbi:MAG: DUF1697 domain-containing protein [Candidatus Levybacteria bacterium]|nr:DUF1697 domain-containing protein [Candidatus Levybacteria bacterium]